MDAATNHRPGELRFPPVRLNACTQITLVAQSANVINLKKRAGAHFWIHKTGLSLPKWRTGSYYYMRGAIDIVTEKLEVLHI